MRLAFSTAVGLVALSTVAAHAGWFGPSNYTECMIDGMKGQPSAMKGTISKACESKFPCASAAQQAAYLERRKSCISEGREFQADPQAMAFYTLECVKMVRADICPTHPPLPD